MHNYQLMRDSLPPLINHYVLALTLHLGPPLTHIHPSPITHPDLIEEKPHFDSKTGMGASVMHFTVMKSSLGTVAAPSFVVI